MFEFFFGRRSALRKSAPKRRSLQLESLENRELLSVSPLDFAPVAETAIYAESTPQSPSQSFSTEAGGKLDPLLDVKVIEETHDDYYDETRYTVGWTRPESQWNFFTEYQLSSDNGATWESKLTIGHSDWFRLPPDTVWLFRARAVDVDIASYTPSDWSETITLKSDSTKAPPDPYNFTAKKQANGSLSFTWEDRSYNEVGFELQRSTDNGATWETVQTVARDKTSALVSSPGEDDRYRLCAFNNTGNSAWLTVSTKSSLDAPTGLTATWNVDSRYWDTVDLTWNAVEGATEYVIQRSITGSNKWETVNSWSDTKYSDDSFYPQENYTYRVLASNSVAKSVAGPETADIYCPNGSYWHPIGLKVTSVSFSAIGLSWKAYEGAASYQILRYDRANPNESSQTMRVIGTTTGLTFTDANQKKGANYHYQIWACDAQGNRIETESLVQTAKEDPPKTPTSVKGVALDSETVSVTWKQSGTASWIYVEYALAGTGNWQEAGLLDESEKSAVIGELQPLTKYDIRVAVENSEGISAFSKPVSVTTKAAVPESVDECLAVVQSDKIVNLSWNAVEHATSYIVERSTEGGAWKKVTTVKGKTEYTDKSLKGLTEYQYRITAVSAAGSAQPGGGVYLVTKAVSPGAPTLKIVQGVVNVSWKAVKGIDDYRVERSLDGQTWTTVAESTTSTSFADTAVAGNTSYSYRVISVGWDEDTDSAPSKTKTIKTAPEGPTGIQLKSVADKTAALTWDAIPGATSYKVEKFVNGKWSSAGSSKTNSLTVKSLKPLVEYTFRITAVSKAGSSTPSESISVKTLVSTPKAPTLKTLGSDSVNLKWKQVKEATGYSIQRAPSGTTAWEDVETVANGSKPTYTDTGLAANTAYQYRIIALGTSEATNSLASPASKAATTAPAAPIGFTAVPDTKTVALSWTSVSGATSYKIEKYVNGKWSSAGTSKTASTTVKSLKPSTDYVFRVTAVSKAGKSTPSEEIQARTL